MIPVFKPMVLNLDAVSLVLLLLLSPPCSQDMSVWCGPGARRCFCVGTSPYKNTACANDHLRRYSKALLIWRFSFSLQTAERSGRSPPGASPQITRCESRAVAWLRGTGRVTCCCCWRDGEAEQIHCSRASPRASVGALPPGWWELLC